MKSHGKFEPSIADFSGHNWDDVALSLLVEISTHQSRFATSQPLMNDANGTTLIGTLHEDEATLTSLGSLNSLDSPDSPDHHSFSSSLDSSRDGEGRVGSDLSHSDLHGADLRHADLRNANLNKANLCEARLDKADLRGADLRGADLRSAHLAAARVQETRLHGAMFNQWTDLPFDKNEALKKGMIYLEISPSS